VKLISDKYHASSHYVFPAHDRFFPAHDSPHRRFATEVKIMGDGICGI
jgi:hypothetical protein